VVCSSSHISAWTREASQLSSVKATDPTLTHPRQQPSIPGEKTRSSNISSSTITSSIIGHQYASTQPALPALLRSSGPSPRTMQNSNFNRPVVPSTCIVRPPPLPLSRRPAEQPVDGGPSRIKQCMLVQPATQTPEAMRSRAWLGSSMTLCSGIQIWPWRWQPSRYSTAGLCACHFWLS